MKKITPQEIKKMGYVDLMAFLEEVNRPPGGKDSIRAVVQNCFINKDSKVLDIGCNTGYCTFEIAHLAKCSIIGIDINGNMIKSANKIRKKDPLGYLIKFQMADGQALPFKKETFDVVISGGSTAFIDDKKKAIKEYSRVVKPWGFIADINFYYKIKPPAILINRLNTLMDINIKPWNLNYWLDLYKSCDLEVYSIYTNDVKVATSGEIKNYCREMTKNNKNLSKEAKEELLKRLVKIMRLFSENHKYLNYGVFILRKRPIKEQISLFGA